MLETPTSSEAELAVGGGDLLGKLDVFGLVQALSSVLMRAGVSGIYKRGGRLCAEHIRIAANRSQVSPTSRDWRFKNRAWRDHPLYRRLGQSYLAWVEEIMGLVDDAGLDWRTDERARFVLNNLTAALAPSNCFPLNPDAWERAFETAGRSVLKGWRNIGRDIVQNHGRPRSVNRGSFELGRNMAATPGAVVYKDDVCELIQYAPRTQEVWETPVVVVPPQINKYYIMDLSPGRSFIEHAVEWGFQTYAVSWRNPTGAQRHWNLDTYVGALNRALAAAAEICSNDAVNVVGVCAGGLTTASLLGHLAALNDGLVRSATFAVTQIDYDVPSMIGMFGTARVVGNSTRISARSGALNGAMLETMFAALRPNDLIWNYWVNNNLLGEDPSTFDVLAWNADSTALPADLHASFLDIYLRNGLARGEVSVLGTPVNLAKVDCDTLVVAGRTDHLVPWKACYANCQLFGGRSEFVLTSSGHIQSLVNPPGSPRMSVMTGADTDRGADQWMAQSDESPGVWWEQWAKWQACRAGAERKAPNSLGSPTHPALVAAPGDYVRNR
jgi:polyhydroxyalkanoate synthase subunit PhaC